jgi:flagellar biosynthesis protein FlhG
MHDQATRMREIAAGRRGFERGAAQQVITVTSGKGGVGKSTVALNFAIVLAEMGKSVLLVDADANLANLDVMLGLSPRFRLSHLLRGEADLEDVLISPVTGLRVLPGSSGEVDYPMMSAEQQEELLDSLRGMDDRPEMIIVDTSAGLSPEIVGFAARSSEVLVVTSSEPTAMVDAYAIIKILSASAGEVPVSVLLNGVRLPKEAEETAGKLRIAVSHFLRRDIGYAGFIPHDVSAQHAVLRQEPLVRAFPRSGAALSVRALAQRYADRRLSDSIRKAEAS